MTPNWRRLLGPNVTESTGRKGRLLAVDDNIDSADLIVRVARNCGYQAQSMVDLRPLRDVIASWKPDVLTLDLGMPQEDGIATIATLKEGGFSGALIVVSGQDQGLRQAARRLATALGLRVAGDMQKPVDLKSLRQLLTELQSAN